MSIFNLKDRAKSFAYAINGLRILIKTQHNMWVHLVITLLVLMLGAVFKVSATDWVLLIISITLVWLAEALNTAIEFLADAVTLEHNALIGKAKDVAAGAVLIASIGAAIIGVVVFYPYLLAVLFRS